MQRRGGLWNTAFPLSPATTPASTHCSPTESRLGILRMESEATRQAGTVFGGWYMQFSPLLFQGHQGAWNGKVPKSEPVPIRQQGRNPCEAI